MQQSTLQCKLIMQKGRKSLEQQPCTSVQKQFEKHRVPAVKTDEPKLKDRVVDAHILHAHDLHDVSLLDRHKLAVHSCLLRAPHFTMNPYAFSAKQVAAPKQMVTLGYSCAILLSIRLARSRIACSPPCPPRAPGHGPALSAEHLSTHVASLALPLSPTFWSWDHARGNYNKVSAWCARQHC